MSNLGGTAPLGFGVIGAGRIGALHARNVAGAIDGARLVTVYDADASAATGAAFAGADVASSVDAVLARTDVDAVLIASPTPLHAEQIAAAAAAGKAIFCEKPVALDLPTTQAAIDAVHQARVPFQIGFNRRYDPSFGALGRAVHDGRIGRPEMLRSLSSDPAPPPEAYVAVSGGIYLDSAIHDLDMARWVMGEVRTVTAVGRVLVEEYVGVHGDVDTSVVTLEFTSGALGVVQNTRRTVYGYDLRLEVHGASGKLVAEDALDPKVWRYGHDGISAPHVHYFLDRFREAYRLEVQAFVDAVRAGVAPTPGPDDAVASLRLALAAKASRETGVPVEVGS